MSLEDKIKLIIIKAEMKKMLDILANQPMGQIFSPADPWGEENWDK